MAWSEREARLLLVAECGEEGAGEGRKEMRGLFSCGLLRGSGGHSCCTIVTTASATPSEFVRGTDRGSVNCSRKFRKDSMQGPGGSRVTYAPALVIVRSRVQSSTPTRVNRVTA